MNLNLSPLFETAISIIVVYFLFSNVISALTESVYALLRVRGSFLKDELSKLLNDDSRTGFKVTLLSNLLNRLKFWNNTKFIEEVNGSAILKRFYNNPIVKNITKELPSYIAGINFSKVLIDEILSHRNDVDEKNIFDKLKEEITKPSDEGILKGNEALRKVLKGLLNTIDTTASNATQNISNQLKALEDNITKWFDDSMERATGAFKRMTYKYNFIIAFIVALSFNVDSIRIARYLWSNPASREQMLVLGEAIKNNPKAESSTQSIKPIYTNALDSARIQYNIAMEHYNKLVKGGLPVGWANQKFTRLSFLGWLITAFAMMFGAQFWFDALMKISSIRSSIPPKDDKKK